MLRSLPMDATVAPRRRLFELGTLAQHTSNAVDYHTRHQLLSKIINNSTTRSNVFFVFMQVEFFEAAVTEDVNGNGILDQGEDVFPPGNPPGNGRIDSGPKAAGRIPVRIGAKLTDTPTHRGFFVVDRTRAMEQLQQLHFLGNEDHRVKLIL